MVCDVGLTLHSERLRLNEGRDAWWLRNWHGAKCQGKLLGATIIVSMYIK